MKCALIALVVAALALPAAAAGSAPMAGVAEKVPSGLFADVSMGGLFTAGATYGASRAQPFLQLTAGYDLLRFGDRYQLSVGAQLGLGSSAASCFAQRSSDGRCVFDASKGSADPHNLAPDSFAVTFVGAEAVIGVQILERVFLRPRVEAGYGVLDPAPIRDGSTAISGGAYLGAGIGLEYATRLNHLSLGFEVGVREIIGPNIPVFSFSPAIRYTL